MAHVSRLPIRMFIGGQRSVGRRESWWVDLGLVGRRAPTKVVGLLNAAAYCVGCASFSSSSKRGVDNVVFAVGEDGCLVLRCGK